MRQIIVNLASQIQKEFERRGYTLKNKDEIYDCADYLELSQCDVPDYTVAEYVNDTVNNYPEILEEYV
jgi:hypothetical protein